MHSHKIVLLFIAIHYLPTQAMLYHCIKPLNAKRLTTYGTKYSPFDELICSPEEILRQIETCKEDIENEPFYIIRCNNPTVYTKNTKKIEALLLKSLFARHLCCLAKEGRVYALIDLLHNQELAIYETCYSKNSIIEDYLDNHAKYEKPLINGITFLSKQHTDRIQYSNKE